jgi:F-type H+-transporting ATPase subunit epsilon
MATFHFDLVSPEKLVFSGEVEQVDIPGVDGDLRRARRTCAAGGDHSSRHHDGDGWRPAEKVVVLGGLAEVSAKGLTVLADVATSVRGLRPRGFRGKIRDGRRSAKGAGATRSIAPSSASITSRRSTSTCKVRRCIERRLTSSNEQGWACPAFSLRVTIPGEQPASLRYPAS